MKQAEAERCKKNRKPEYKKQKTESIETYFLNFPLLSPSFQLINNVDKIIVK
jgi:hypothetical protein